MVELVVGGRGHSGEQRSQTSAHTATVDTVGRGSSTPGSHPLALGVDISWRSRKECTYGITQQGLGDRSGSGFITSAHIPLARTQRVGLMIPARSILAQWE